MKIVFDNDKLTMGYEVTEEFYWDIMKLVIQHVKGNEQ